MGADVRVGGVNGDEQRAQAFGQHPLQVHLGEPGQGGEVAVEERQPVVVVLQGEAPAHSLGQLLDEAELTMVVAGAHPIEEGRGHLHPEWLARLFAHRHRERLTHPATADHEVQFRLVDQQAVLNDVARGPSVEQEEFVPGPKAGQIRR
jgi:hypothetical protein